MSWRGKRAAAAEPVRMALRYAQALQDGQVRLQPFTQPELDCVTLDPDALAPDIRGPALLAAAPLLAGLAASRLGGGDDPESAELAWAEAGLLETSDDAELAAAAAGLEARGLIRAGVAAPCDVNVPEEFAGWSADPAGGSAPRQVGITGDLGVITRMRSQPYWVAEVNSCATPATPDPVTAPWQLTGRMYAAYRPPSALAEIPRADGAPPLFTLLWEDQAVRALAIWCGFEQDELPDRPRPADAGLVPPAAPSATAAVAPEFTSLTRLRIAHPDGQQARVRILMVATGSERRHWLLTGDRAQLATPASVDQFAEQIGALLQPVDRPEP